MHSYSFGEPGADGQREKITLINQKVESKAEAETFAQSALRNKNEAENTGYARHQWGTPAWWPGAR